MRVVGEDAVGHGAAKSKNERVKTMAAIQQGNVNIGFRVLSSEL